MFVRQAKRNRVTHWLPACVLATAGLMTSTGCQMDIAGQTLPSPYYLQDDVAYYAPGSEFKLANEAAAMKAQEAVSEDN